MIADLKDRTVNAHEDCFVAPTATVVGSVELAEGSSVWFGAVLRGDCEQLSVGKNSNVQDGAVLHADPGFPLQIGEGVTIGHNATVHGCVVGQNSLIGINAVVLNGARIGNNCLIGASALVPEGMEIPDGSLVLGAPAKVKRSLSEKEIEGLKLSAQHYADNGRRFREEMAIRP
ncbi:gamma carbonic anhydrase family protein [Pseudomaricurvus alkylphenolicus]|uniref:DapH/DapD/GlmU-related protein n=1 Tax=Pseudomaricurvus alkylphenolicus TaxID=1306991 RepID=UPI001421B632|nr:gamma carbonic anhydrase family protein [Pseudomaricurvus alkylphenolicus]